MNRRNFITGAAALSALPLSSIDVMAQNSQIDPRQFFELIHYELPTGKNKNRVQQYYKNAAIPALNKIGIMNVGVFSVAYGSSAPSMYVLLQHKNLESVLNWQGKLMKNQEYLEKGKDYLQADLSSPAYIRKSSSIFRGFKEMPIVEAPVNLLNKPRIFELRIYESHTYQKAQKKIEMFNEGGEIEIFRKTGLTPVFFGEAIAGGYMPNLTYMLVFENMKERDENWETFINDPDWEVLKNDKQYADTVSNIMDIILRPVDGSQI